MENRNLVLITLAQMAAESAQPTLYQFIPRELILRLPIDWSAIYSALTVLEEEGAVQIFHADTVKFSITEKGIELSKNTSTQKSLQ
jgi:predicted transcriptional regulator